MIVPLSRRCAALVLATGLLALPACGKRGASVNSGLKGSHTVRGKVTFKGEPVPYGFIRFYSMEKSQDGNDNWTAAAVAPIQEDGSYLATSVPEGKMFVSVATDPDVDAHSLIQPGNGAAGGGIGGPPMMGAGPPFAGGPPMFGGGPPMPGGGPPQAGGPLLAGGPPKAGGFQPVPVEIPKEIPVDKRPPDQGKFLNPATKDLSEAQKDRLREIHKRYGNPGPGPLLLDVQPGEQTFDLKL